VRFNDVKKSSIFFVPTAISLLTAIFLLLSLNNIRQYLQSCETPELYKFNLISDTGPFGKAYLNRSLNKKNIRTYILTGTEEDSIKFRLIREDALRMKFTCDTFSVIKVHFRAEATYGEFFYLNKIMKQNRIRRYGLLDSDFFIFGPALEECLEEEPPNDTLEIRPLQF
jgi:hypothetical protein